MKNLENLTEKEIMEIANNEIRKAIEQMVDEAWELCDQAKTPQEAEKYKLHVLELLSRLPENEVHLKIMQ